MIDTHHPARHRITRIPVYQNSKISAMTAVRKILDDYDWYLHNGDANELHGYTGRIVFEICNTQGDTVGFC